MRLLTFQRIVIGFVLLFHAGASAAQNGAQRLADTPLAIETADGHHHNFTVEVAQSRQERGIGLMFRPELAESRGMIFQYEGPRVISIWMKNTFVPLDILFIGADGRIVNIAHDATPHSEDSIFSDGEVVSALELAAGVTEKLGIEPGDLVRHRIFGNLDENEK